jgi:poly-gamma-glutamate synthesis protein (capsule biosynthesis protein)
MKWILRVTLFLAIIISVFLILPPSFGSAGSLLKLASGGVLPALANVSNSNKAPLNSSLWISPAVPPSLRLQAIRLGIPLETDQNSAALHLGVENTGQDLSTWVYVLVAPFPTVTDGITSPELLANWRGTPTGVFAGLPILMDASTFAAFTAKWGAPAPGSVQIVPTEQLLDKAWSNKPSWAIIPFESLDPRWKVLAVDGQSPIHKDFVPVHDILGGSIEYPLSITFGLACSSPCPFQTLPRLTNTNRDPSKLTTLIMTGVTALVRATAYTMDIKGVTYPGLDIYGWLRQADITHISNEVPFYNKCPKPNPSQSRLVFCSDPRYIDLLNFVGTDVVELTGNHFADHGPGAMLYTLALYRQNNMQYYGGGSDLADSQKPLLIENNGNKIAFIGCNSVDIENKATASKDHPGAAPCDYEMMVKEIRQLRSQGYIVITSFQYYETYDPKPFDAQLHDFRLMADAGANIIQGSQAHLPQMMEFYQGGFIHYGLGNLFFDQMGDSPWYPTRREFLDRHVFYDGHYISTELLTALLEDYSRPRPMTPQERAAFLGEYFSISGW